MRCRYCQNADASKQQQSDELAALRRLYNVARRHYGRHANLDAAVDAVEGAR